MSVFIRDVFQIKQIEKRLRRKLTPEELDSIEIYDEVKGKPKKPKGTLFISGKEEDIDLYIYPFDLFNHSYEAEENDNAS